MNFHNQKFLLKICPDGSHYIPRKKVGFSFLTSDFRFFCSHDKGFSISSEKSRISLEVGDTLLKGFRLNWRFDEKLVEVNTDKYSLYPLLVMPGSDGSLWFSNTSEYFSALESNFKLSSKAVNHFFTHAYLYPDDFFIEGVKRISGSWSFEFGQSLNVPSCRWREDSVTSSENDIPRNPDQSAERTLEIFCSIVKTLLHSNDLDRFLLSGGFDSRAIVLAAKILGLDLPPIHILRFPQTYASKDLDYEVAARYCQKENLGYSTLIQDSNSISLFGNFVGMSILSGLYGGDLLGGCWEYCLPLGVDKIFEEFVLSEEGLEEIKSQQREIQKFSELERELLGQQIFTHSDRSLIFFNVNMGWASPLANMRVSVSPFALTPFIEQTLRTPQASRRFYKHYLKFFRFLSAGEFFPACSYLVDLAPEYAAPKEWGENLKKYSPKKRVSTEMNLKVKNSNIGEESYSFLVERGVQVDRRRFMSNSLKPAFQRLCWSIRWAFPAYFDEQIYNPNQLESQNPTLP